MFMFFKKKVGLACWQSAHRSHPSQPVFLWPRLFTLSRESAWDSSHNRVWEWRDGVCMGWREALAGFGTGISTPLPHL